jgi:hypothetical protein
MATSAKVVPANEWDDDAIADYQRSRGRGRSSDGMVSTPLHCNCTVIITAGFVCWPLMI